ncbi:Hint domain-containing protein [Pseudorhodobacter sp.]|uniref:Hint domain-containing protein n=1 Tax=Pseudorhodobacter sp. TaxID=1934400 RepID=UPI0026480735|nr:Hint domain-containing protein [Pseudorhodobacter sp.]MDN5786262.1 Hint domain-containing protein [Pseudorhodobacter sp.]
MLRMDIALTAAPNISMPPEQVCQVFPAPDIFVSIGVNLGDGLTELEACCLGDIYELAADAAAYRLVLLRDDLGQIVAQNSGVGVPGERVVLNARYTMLAPDGDKVELLALRLRGSDQNVVLPLSPIGSQIEYTLIKAEEAHPEERLLDLLCISFERGTMITLGNGSQRPIEALSPGDRILTRDHGPKPLRWVGNVTLRAVGAYAPVIIPAGVLGNDRDLVVSQHHRMFLYQRNKSGGMPQAEILVQAKHLVDHENIFLRESGYVDYFSLIFDDHEIIYAEGIPAESLMVTDATLSRLPPRLAAEVKELFPDLSQNQHFGVEAGRDLLNDLALKRRARK